MLFMELASTSSNVRKMANTTVMSIKIPYIIPVTTDTKAKSSAVSFYKCQILLCKKPLSSIFISNGCCVSDNVNVKRQTHTSALIPFPYHHIPARAEHTLELSKQCSVLCCLF